MDLSVRSSALFHSASVKKSSSGRDDLSDHSGSFRSRRGPGSDFDSNESDTLNDDDDDDQDNIADMDHDDMDHDTGDRVLKARKPFHPLDLTRK